MTEIVGMMMTEAIGAHQDLLMSGIAEMGQLEVPVADCYMAKGSMETFGHGWVTTIKIAEGREVGVLSATGVIASMTGIEAGTGIFTGGAD